MASTRPSPLRVRVARTWEEMSSTSGSYKSASTMALARLVSGSPPGRMTVVSQLEPAPAIVPLSNSGMRPARTREDLPLPEVPTTATNRFLRRRVVSSVVC
ncbi:MAG: hypothetical protein QF721_04330 [Verrucomicrobiota bacterium]|nr:hypothetical protein [Verrucomicrobiota bacterium]